MQANSPVFVPAAHRSSPFVSPAPIEYVSPPVLYNPSPQSNTGPKGSRLGVRRPLTVPSSSAPGLLGGGGAQRRSKRDGADGGKDVREEKGRPDVGESKKMTSVAALDLMREIKGLQLALAQSLDNMMPWIPQVEHQRQHIRRQYLTLLFGYPQDVADLSLFDSHWMQTTHNIIAVYRSHPALKAALTNAAFKMHASTSAGSKSTEKGPVGLNQDQKVVVKKFQQFLATEVQNYQKMEVRLVKSFNLVEVEGYLPWLSAAVGGGEGQTSVLPSSVEPPSDQRTKKLAVFVKGLIFLGDLERYKEMYAQSGGGRGTANTDREGGGRRGRSTIPVSVAVEQAAETQGARFEKAREYYDTARLIMPENGNPFNQLATISTYLRDRFASTYYFLRALAVKESFVTARGNLQATLKGPLEAHQTARSDDPSALTKHALQSKVVILLAMLLLRTGFESSHVGTTLHYFKSLIQARSLSVETTLRTLITFLAVHWDARLTRPGPRSTSNDSSVKPKIDAELLSLEVIVQLHTVLFETAASDLADTFSVTQKSHLNDPSSSILSADIDDASQPAATTNNLDKFSQHLGTVLRRSLPALRVASKWIRAHQDYLARIQRKHALTNGPDHSDDQPAPVLSKIRQMFTSYVDLMNALSLAFPSIDLCPLESPLEEDLELGGFGPLRKMFPPRRADLSAVRDGHPNEEHFMRIWDLHRDVSLLLKLESSTVTIQNGRFATISQAKQVASRPSANTPPIIKEPAPSTARPSRSFSPETADDVEIVNLPESSRVSPAVPSPSANLSSSIDISPALPLEPDLNFADLDLEDDHDPVDAAMRAALGDSDEFDSDEEAQLGMTMSMHWGGEAEERIVWPPASANKRPSVQSPPIAPVPPSLPSFELAPQRSSGLTAMDLLQQLGSGSALQDVQPSAQHSPYGGSPASFVGAPLPTSRNDSIWGSSLDQSDRGRSQSLAPSGWGAPESGTISPGGGFGLPLSDSWARSTVSSQQSRLGNGGFSHPSLASNGTFSSHGQQSAGPHAQSHLDAFQPQLPSSNHDHFGQFSSAHRSHSVPGLPAAPYGPSGATFPTPGVSAYQPSPLASPGGHGAPRSPWG